MVVQHNLTAMNSNRMLGITTGTQAKSTEKLSSGYKINRAADDAAGLSISEKMRKQIRGLTQASLNAQDGISAVQTAEGALTEVHDMLQRMNELAVKAANGTNSEDDRKYIQDEIDQLVEEIDRVSETTKFNETYLLKGDGTATREVEKTIPEQEAVEMTATYVNAVADTVSLQDGKTAPTWYLKGSAGVLSAAEVLDNLELDENGAVVIKEGVEIYTAAADTAGEFGDQLKTTKVDNTAVQALYEKVTNALAKSANPTAADFLTDEDLEGFFQQDGSYAGGLYAKNSNGDYVEVGAEQIAQFVEVVPGKDAVAATTETEEEEYTKALTLSLHVGADSTEDNQISIDIESMSAKGLGLLDEDGKLLVDGKDDTNARAAIDTIAAAIQRVSTQRSALGAVQNRLEHTINNLDNVVENTTAAESQIRDTDMATEMVKYSNNNILAQAGQAMLAQANQANQGVLSLLG